MNDKITFEDFYILDPNEVLQPARVNATWDFFQPAIESCGYRLYSYKSKDRDPDGLQMRPTGTIMKRDIVYPYGRNKLPVEIESKDVLLHVSHITSSNYHRR